MAFSLTYAFGRMGRHVRKISSEARSFLGTKFRNLEPGPLRDFLFAQCFAIDTTLFRVFYNEDTSDPFYPIHVKYANKLLDATGCDFLRLGRVYSCGIIVAQSSPDSSPVSEQQVATTLGILRMINFVYGGSEPEDFWASLVLRPDASIIAAAVCQGIAQVLQADPRDKASFGDDWLSLIPRIHATTNALLAKPDWAKTAASLLESRDFGGSQA
jgi:hypothetical protein